MKAPKQKHAKRKGRRHGPKTPPREGAARPRAPQRRGEKPLAAKPGPRPSRPPRPEEAGELRPGRLWIYGRHAAEAAITNPRRKIRRILAGENALDWLASLHAPKARLSGLVEASPEMLERALHEGAVHQGIAVEVEDLPRARLKEACGPDGSRRPVVVLDQITDPHNIGAIFRSAAAFGARAVVVQERRTPPLAGALAKAAAGAIEIVPCVPVVNIARALEGLKGLGYFCAGLAGEAPAPVSALPADRPIALVLGAEGTGLRPLVARTCDGLFRIPIAPSVESLNVSVAAAISLYAATSRSAQAA